MAISLKRYDRQVGVSAETGTQAIGGGLASTMIQEAGLADQVAAQTFQMLGETGAEIYKDFQKRNDEAELARINKEFLIDSTAFQEQLELLNDEEDIAELSRHFTATQGEKINNFKLSPETKRQALISFDNNLAKQNVLVGSRILKLGLQKQDNNYLDQENTAISTGNEELYAEAQRNRVAIGTLSYENSLKKIRDFNENASDGIFQQLLRAEQIKQAEELLYSKEAKFSRDAYKENIILLEAAKNRLQLKQVRSKEQEFSLNTQAFRNDLSAGNVPVQLIPILEEAGVDVNQIQVVQANMDLGADMSEDPADYKKGSSIVDNYRNESNPTTFAKAFNDIYSLKGLTVTSRSELIQELFDISDEMGSKDLGFQAIGFGGQITVVKSTGWKNETQKNSFIELNNNYEKAFAKARGEEQFDRLLQLYAEDRKKLQKYWQKNSDATPEEWNLVSQNYLGNSASYSVRRSQPVTPQIGIPFKGNDGLTYIITSINEDGTRNFARVED
jgi:hypothetical protein